MKRQRKWNNWHLFNNYHITFIIVRGYRIYTFDTNPFISCADDGWSNGCLFVCFVIMMQKTQCNWHPVLWLNGLLLCYYWVICLLFLLFLLFFFFFYCCCSVPVMLHLWCCFVVLLLLCSWCSVVVVMFVVDFCAVVVLLRFS